MTALPLRPRAIRLWQAFALRSNFRHHAWSVQAGEARALLVLSLFVDLLAQFWLGDPDLLTVAASALLPICFWNLPSRLAAGAGGLLLVQATGSILVVLLTTLVGLPHFLVDAAAFTWWLYCFTALVMLFLAYLRTPKSQMPQ